jgi:hypothetical protein
MIAGKAHLRLMGDLQRLFGVKSTRPWTQPDSYVEAMARKRRFRRANANRPRTQPERPRLMLSTLPFLTLLALLGVMAVAIMVLAFPGNRPPRRPHATAQPERGTAAPGWFQDAKQHFHG